MRIEALQQRLREAGAKPCHEDQFFRAWTRAADPRLHPRQQQPPRGVVDAISELQAALTGQVRLVDESAGDDGSSKLLVALSDGRTIESVLLPRDGLCVSTQVGCAVGCTFCMTGRGGLLRQLSDTEIVAQVVLGRQRRQIRKVVFMGMGEPSHNLGNVLRAIDILGTYGAIAHKNLVFSTVGDHRVFERLPLGRVKPALALSLHSTRVQLRKQLLPNAAPISPDELVALGEIYARRTGYPIQYQWTLIEGINDSDEELSGLVKLLSGKLAVMNLIPCNPIEGSGFRQPSAERAAAMSLHLYRNGILTKIRDSAGAGIGGACGQLRARALDKQ